MMLRPLELPGAQDQVAFFARKQSHPPWYFSFEASGELRMKRGILLAGAASAVLCGHAWAADVPAAAGVEEVVVVGSRGAQRLATETSAPTDVFSAAKIQATGVDGLAKTLQFLEPSFNYAPAGTLATAVGTRPASMFGLGPDQVLVLVNGHRQHAASVLDTNSGYGRGTVPVDLNIIPVAAIERVEILRDGASAQYGSDAIAGVINIVLRHDSAGGLASVQGGVTEKGDGGTGIGTVRQGFGLPGGGFMTLTAEARYRDFTNSTGIDSRFGRVTQRIGDPRSLDLDLIANAEAPFAWGTVYGFLNLARRKTESSPLWRVPSTFPAFYPGGFLVLITQKTTDLGGALGVRGAVGDWKWDLSDTPGYNRADFRPSNTVNTSLGTASPTSFDAGGARYGQNLLNLTVDRAFDGFLAGAHIAVGAEQRYEWYTLRPGEPSSYFGTGAQGLVGLNPRFPIHNVDRTAYSAFLDGELSPIKGLSLGAAVRYEHYSDFGDNTTGKVSAFWRATPFLALRATASTGFRAPSLQQESYSSVSSQLVNGGLVNVLLAAVDDPVARALGATPLKPETSQNYSAGVVLTPGHGFSLTADAFRIPIRNRIVLSEFLSGSVVTNALTANNIPTSTASQVRFFTNAADTLTEGYELGLHYKTSIGDGAVLQLSAGYAAFENKLTTLRKNPAAPNVALLGLTSIDILTTAEPRNKLTINADLAWRRWQFSVDVTRFGQFRFVPLAAEQTFRAATTVNLSAAYDITKDLLIRAGITNANNAYPDQVIGQVDGRRYLETGGLGLNGREYYVRLTKTF